MKIHQITLIYMKSGIREQILELNRLGIIPGPGETDLEFAKRAEYCLSFQEHFLNIFEGDPLLCDYEPPPKEVMEEGFEHLLKLYQFSPDWVPIFFSNYQLTPWHGGCAWIIQVDSDSPTTALFQLRKAFKKQDIYLGIYSRKELIAHESCHVGRMMFEEPKFEEILAYKTSCSSFRQIFGPIIQSKGETLWFMITVIAILLMDFYFLFTGSFEGYLSMMWFKSLPLIMIMFALARLSLRHYQFLRSFKNISSAVKNKDDTFAVMFRLTDDEIIYFAKMKPEEIVNYFEQYATHDLRCYLLFEAYFRPLE